MKTTGKLIVDLGALTISIPATFETFETFAYFESTVNSYSNEVQRVLMNTMVYLFNINSKKLVNSACISHFQTAVLKILKQRTKEIMLSESTQNSPCIETVL